MQDRQRQDALLAQLDRDDLAALVSFAPEDVLLVSGYWPVMAASVAVLTREGAIHVILPQDELELAQATAESGADLIPYQPETLERLSTVTEALEQPVRELAERMRLGDGRVGVLLSDTAQTQSYQSGNHFHGAMAPLLRECYPKVALVDAGELLKRAKSIKTAAELSALRRLCGLAKTGFDAASGAVAAGQREDQIAADVNRAYACVAQDGFERGHGYFYCMSGPNSTKAAAAFARTRQRVVEDGDLVMIHTNTVGDGLWTDITRTYTAGAAGTEDAQQRRMRQAIAEARCAALAAVAPGAQASAVDAAARQVLTAHGFGKAFKHAVGHGVGFGAADPRALPRLHPESPDVLAEGMTFNLEPAIYIDGVGGMRHCDVVACTSAGAEVLTDF